MWQLQESPAKQQAVAFLEHAKEIELPPKLVMHDRDTNAYVERFIQTLQQEVLDHFVVFGERHMDHLVSETVEHYHDERPHQSLGKAPQVPTRAKHNRSAFTRIFGVR